MDAKRFILKLAGAVALCVAASGCVYPFEPDFKGDDIRLVVEGTIQIGAVSTFKASSVRPLGTDFTPSPVIMRGYIEGEDGTRVLPTIISDRGRATGDYAYGSINFDTRDLRPDQKYRLHLEKPGEDYVCETDWLEVDPAPVIDDLRYILDWDRNELNVALSMHCNGSSRFRWSFEETWEYHAPLWANYYLDYSKMYQGGEYWPLEAFLKFENGENNYYCWQTQASPSFKVFSTADQVDDRFTDLEFHRVPRSDGRLETVYRLTVYLQAMSDDAYLYWNNIQQNSDQQGTIMSPVPSQMRGNIRCTSNPESEVIGFVSAAEVAIAQMYYIDLEEKFYNGTAVDWREINIVDEVDPYQFARWYSINYRPYTKLEPEMGSGQTDIIYQWAPSRCVDCRLAGGTKTKPEGWPNNHK